MEKGSRENPRHILGLSGGKDSTALAIYIKEKRPEIFDKLEIFFTDTGTELPEIYDYLTKVESYLGKEIIRLKATVTEENGAGYKISQNQDDSIPFNQILYDRWKGFLPSPMARWCTRELKVFPMEKWTGKDYCYSYIGIRNDEPIRTGYQGRRTKKENRISPVYPYREDGLIIDDVYRILNNTIGLPDYYKWRTRSGCFFCFYQRRVEYAVLYHLHPDLFKKAKEYEKELDNGKKYTWLNKKPLEYIEQNSIAVIKRYVRLQYNKTSNPDQFTYTLDEMYELIDQGRIKEFIDSWDLKKLHDVDGENKDCGVCSI